MPFCTESGARHDDAARVCPRCGAPIAQPPDELEDLLGEMDTIASDEPRPAGTRAADRGGARADEKRSSDYLEEMQAVRGAIASQSTALQSLTDLSWSNPEANAIRDQLAAALERLPGLRPPAAVGSAREGFLG